MENVSWPRLPGASLLPAWCFWGLGWWFYAKARRIYKTWDGEEEAPIEKAEEDLSWALLMSAIAMLWDFFFRFGAGGLPRDVPMGRLGGLGMFLCFHRGDRGAPAEGGGSHPPHQSREAGQRL